MNTGRVAHALLSGHAQACRAAIYFKSPPADSQSQLHGRQAAAAVGKLSCNCVRWCRGCLLCQAGSMSFAFLLQARLRDWCSTRKRQRQHCLRARRRQSPLRSPQHPDCTGSVQSQMHAWHSQALHLSVKPCMPGSQEQCRVECICHLSGTGDCCRALHILPCAVQSPVHLQPHIDGRLLPCPALLARCHTDTSASANSQSQGNSARPCMSGCQVQYRAQCICNLTAKAKFWHAQHACLSGATKASQLGQMVMVHTCQKSRLLRTRPQAALALQLPPMPCLACSAPALTQCPSTPTSDLPTSCGLASTLLVPPTQEFRPPHDLQLPPEPSAEALLRQQPYPARTAAGQYWSAGGHLPREPFQVVPGNGSTGKAPECALAEPRLGGTAKVMVQLQRLQVPLLLMVFILPALCCILDAACVTA